MKIIITANIVPFTPGGADYHINGLTEQLRAFGHDVELLRFPFRFSPDSEIERLMEFCGATDLNMANGVAADKVISLQFPAYGVDHKDHRVWVMHQHRAIYELYNAAEASEEDAAFKKLVTEFDNHNLAKADKLFANSRRVAERLKQYNDIEAEPLYHPPHKADQFYCDDAQDYLFCPSRLESLKRQDLIIEAAQYMRSPLVLLIGGDGGQEYNYQNLIRKLDVGEKVRLIGRFTETEKRVLYARSLGVVFVPHDEDYGYITLEAMLSSKPVITCFDSGGPLEFIDHEDTGFRCHSKPQELALAFDELYDRQQLAREMGKRGRERYETSNISWEHVADRLLSE
jgi:glycosyltransferase involved in cell wall biosynthesis